MTPKNRLETQKKRLAPHKKFFQEKTIFETLLVENDTLKMLTFTQKHIKNAQKK
jgi:hypothetical protein